MPTSKQTAPHEAPSPASKSSLVQLYQNVSTDNPAQASFKRLLRQVDRKRTELEQWRSLDEEYKRRTATELVPLVEREHALQCELAVTLDGLVDYPPKIAGKPLSHSKVKLLKYWLDQLLQELIDHPEHDPRVVAIFERRTGQNVAAKLAAEMESLRARMRHVTGIDLGEQHGARSAEEYVNKLQEKMAQRMAQQEEERQQREAEYAHKAQQEPKTARSKTAQRQAEKQAEREQYKQDVSQSVRDVFRKLAAALHPDHEHDPTERARKTDLMQRVNQAYEKGDLLALLNLQLEVEQVDAAHFSNLSEARLKHYTEVLREQLRELEFETMMFRNPLVNLVRSFGTIVRSLNQTRTVLNADLMLDVQKMRDRISDWELRQSQLTQPEALPKLLDRLAEEQRDEREEEARLNNIISTELVNAVFGIGNPMDQPSHFGGMGLFDGLDDFDDFESPKPFVAPARKKKAAAGKKAATGKKRKSGSKGR